MEIHFLIEIFVQSQSETHDELYFDVGLKLKELLHFKVTSVDNDNNKRHLLRWEIFSV